MKEYLRALIFVRYCMGEVLIAEVTDSFMKLAVSISKGEDIVQLQSLSASGRETTRIGYGRETVETAGIQV